ncbi:hypothetical protein OG21DRAFT_1525493 [Imleria badia]|nr:hypothetical protein OG21DRAFT_1525493 [Imleria badia]
MSRREVELNVECCFGHHAVSQSTILITNTHNLAMTHHPNDFTQTIGTEMWEAVDNLDAMIGKCAQRATMKVSQNELSAMEAVEGMAQMVAESKEGTIWPMTCMYKATTGHTNMSLRSTRGNARHVRRGDFMCLVPAMPNIPNPGKFEYAPTNISHQDVEAIKKISQAPRAQDQMYGPGHPMVVKMTYDAGDTPALVVLMS